MIVLIHPFGRPKRHLFEASADENGRIKVTLNVSARLRRIVARVLDPEDRSLLHRTHPQVIDAIPANWEIAISLLPASALESRTGKGPGKKPQEDEDDVMARPVRSPAALARSRVEAARALRVGLRDAMREEVRIRKENRRKGRALGRRFLGQKPIDGRKNSVFVPEGADPSAVAGELREKALSRWTGYRDRLRGISVYEEDVKKLGLQAGKKVPAHILDGLIVNGFTPRPAGSQVAAILRNCAATHMAEAVEEADDDEVPPPLPDVPSLPQTVADRSVPERIAAILDGVTDGENTRPAIAEIAWNLKQSLPSGPADTESFFDFHSLQIAWEDTWTGLVDDEMTDRIKDLYDTIVDVVDPSDIEADLSEIDELHDLLDSLQDSVQAASVTFAGTLDSAPAWLSGWNEVLAEIWTYLSDTEQEYVRIQWEIEEFLRPRLPISLSTKRLRAFDQFSIYPEEFLPSDVVSALVADLALNPKRYQKRALREVDIAAARAARQDAEAGADPDSLPTNAAARLGRAERLIGELKGQLVKPYQFDVFAKDSYNFGVLATYRQTWTPLGYQAGDLAGAIPLAPNEKRAYTVKRASTTKETSSVEREVSIGHTSESTGLSRAEAEINDTVKRNLNAKKTSEVGVEYAKIVEVTAGSEFGASQDTTSNRIKKEIREATRKATRDHRNDNKVKVTGEATREVTQEETREIENPNNELTVTYLFYELQRKFEISERLHDLQPVILVAYPMPRPARITEAWLLKHDWIIRDALLDQSFAPALIYLSQTFAGDEVSVEILKRQWEAQLAIVTDLRRQGFIHRTVRDATREAINTSMRLIAGTEEALDLTGGGIHIGPNIGKKIVESGGDLAEAELEIARESLEWAQQDVDKIEAEVREAITTLERATQAYVSAVEKRLNRRVQIDRLILHVKENIFHYMQAIWMREHPDARYLRLYDLDIQWPEQTDGSFFALPAGSIGGGRFPNGHLGRKPPKLAGHIKPLPPRFKETRKLHQVADLRKILGFRGNLAVFPLTEQNAISSFMAQDFLDGAFGVSDPDPLAELPTASEALAIAKCAWKRPGLSEKDRQEIAEWLMEALEAAHSVSEEVVIPTGELFIEALPGANTLLEDFKLAHRAYDAGKAKAEWQQSELETIRRAMRLEAGDTADPAVDKRVQITGGDDQSVSIDVGD
ncbi:MAG: hypothetical protein AAGF59_06995 [Pseudomonadota bacterium]